MRTKVTCPSKDCKFISNFARPIVSKMILCAACNRIFRATKINSTVYIPKKWQGMDDQHVIDEG